MLKVSLCTIHICKLNQLKLNQIIKWSFLIGQSNKSNAFDWLKFNLTEIKLVLLARVNGVLRGFLNAGPYCIVYKY